MKKCGFKNIFVKFCACFVLFCLCISLTFCLSGCKKKDNLEKLSSNLTKYDIVLDLDTTTYNANASERVFYINNSEAVLKTVKFHLYPQFFKEAGQGKVVPSNHLNEAYPNGISYAEFEVSRVCVAGVDCPVVYSGECDGILQIDLNSSLMPTEMVEIYIEFNFSLPNCKHRFGYGENTINLGNFYPIACVYENGQFNEAGYNPNGDPFYSDMANYNVKITTDENYLVAASGRKTSENVLNGKKTTNFIGVMVRDFALVVSNKFNVVSSTYNFVNIDYYYFSDENEESSLKAAADAIKTFSNIIGEYPYECYTVVQADFVYGGMEYPNLSLISGDVTNADDYKNVIVHETAHQWWYGLVGNNEFEHPWLDEAAADFCTMLFYDNVEGYNLSHASMIDASRQNYNTFVSVYTDVLGNLDTSMRAIDEYSTEPEYTYCTYVKGVLMYESLYQLLGQKKFVNCLQTYFNDYKYKNATPDDLILSFETASKTELKNFFSSWVEGKVVIR